MFGKILGGLFGLLLAGPVGALLGIVIGHTFDNSLRRHLRNNTAYFGQERQHVQRIFFTSTFLVMGHLAKCDGRVSEYEIQAAQRVMDRMGLTAAQRREARDLFIEGKQAGFAVDPVLRQLYERCHGDRQLLQLFVNIQLQAAYADGDLTTNEHQLLQHICIQLGLEHYNPFAGFNQQSHQYRSQRQHYHQQQSQHSTQSQLQAAYTMLNINETASNAEVKRAYRRQMSQNHPDKLVSKGLPEEMIKLANEKTQQIKDAYDCIKAKRGF